MEMEDDDESGGGEGAEGEEEPTRKGCDRSGD